MSRIQTSLWVAAALVAAMIAAPSSASAYGPVRYVVARTLVRAPVAVVRAPVGVVRTARVVAPPYIAPRAYIGPSVYVGPRVYVAPYGGGYFPY